eukprot:COSAG01_NODE_46770_length_397_cov_0.724832_1_plen_107_part_01
MLVSGSRAVKSGDARGFGTRRSSAELSGGTNLAPVMCDSTHGRLGLLLRLDVREADHLPLWHGHHQRRASRLLLSPRLRAHARAFRPPYRLGGEPRRCEEASDAGGG